MRNREERRSPRAIATGSVGVVLVFALASLAGLPVVAQDVGPTGPSPYDVVEGWLKPFAAPGFAFGGNSGVFAESPDRIFVLQRGETRLPDPVPSGFAGYVGSIGINALRGEGRTWQNCIYVVDGDGNVIEVWDQWDSLFEGTDGPGPHRIRISPYDSERRVWVVHETAHQIFVFSNDGSELRMMLGEKNVVGSDRTHFGQPQDVAFLPDGRVLVADGYENSRVVVLDAEGEYLEEFGEPGDGPGQFDVVHGLAVAPGGRILVADRDNRRIQVFRVSDFAQIGEWPTEGLALDIIVSGSDVWVSHVRPPKLTKFDLDGNRLFSWNLPSEGPTAFLEMHSFAVDSAGNLYGSDNQHGRTQKFVPRADAEPALLVGRRYVPHCGPSDDRPEWPCETEER